VAVPVPAVVGPLVESVTVALTVSGPPVRVNVKLPFPPTVFLVTTTEPRRSLVNVHMVVPPDSTVALHCVAPAG